MTVNENNLRTVQEQDSSNDIQLALLDIVKRPDVDPERLEKFLDLQVKMEERQAEKAYNVAMLGFQADCPIIVRTKKVDFASKSGGRTKYDYAPLDEIVHIIKPHLKNWGLAYSFNVKQSTQNGLAELITIITHSSGHSERYSHFFDPLHDDSRMNKSQRLKSALSYAKRAGLESALGLITQGEDDDAKRSVDIPVTQEQIDEIKKLIDKTCTKESEVLKFCRVDKFEELSDWSGS